MPVDGVLGLDVTRGFQIQPVAVVLHRHVDLMEIQGVVLFVLVEELDQPMGLRRGVDGVEDEAVLHPGGFTDALGDRLHGGLQDGVGFFQGRSGELHGAEALATSVVLD